MINAYTVGYVVCLIGLFVSVGFLVDALNKKKKETDDAKKTKLNGQAVGGGFGVALSIITAIVIGYFHYNSNESEGTVYVRQEDFGTDYTKMVAQEIIDKSKNKEDISENLCKGLFSHDPELEKQFISMTETRPKYEWQNLCRQQASMRV